MPETFDPDAWPHSSGSGSSPSGQRSGQGQQTGAPRRTDDFDDDYEALAFDDDYSTTGPNPNAYGEGSTQAGAQGQGQGGGYDDFDWNDDDDLSTTGGRQSPTADGPSGHGGPSGYGDYDDDYDSQYSDDAYDDYDFDREPEQKGGMGRKIIAALAVVFVIGAIGVLLVTLLGGGDDPKAEDPDASGQTGNGNDGGSNNSTTAPKAVTDSMVAALQAWGQFAADGDLEKVRPYFVNNGPQFDRLQVDAPNIQAKPGAALEMTMANATSIKVDDNNWLVKGTVKVAKAGEKAQNYPWEIRMARQSDKDPWQILSIRQY